MNKSSKTFAAFTMAAILAGGSLFAQDSDTKKAKKDDFWFKKKPLKG